MWRNPLSADIHLFKIEISLPDRAARYVLSYNLPYRPRIGALGNLPKSTVCAKLSFHIKPSSTWRGALPSPKTDSVREAHSAAFSSVSRLLGEKLFPSDGEEPMSPSSPFDLSLSCRLLDQYRKSHKIVERAKDRTRLGVSKLQPKNRQKKHKSGMPTIAPTSSAISRGEIL